MAARKPRRKKDGSYEWPADCACCGSSKLEINGTSLLYQCWSCGFSGALTREEFERVKGAGWEPSEMPAQVFPPFQPGDPTTGLPSGTSLTSKMPQIALQEIERRRQEPAWIIHRYGVRWDGQRLCWPAGQGWSRRAVLSWETPKTISVSPRGLIGEHLLSAGRDENPSCKVQSPRSPQLTHDLPVLSPLRLVLTEGDWKAASIPLPWIGLGLLGKVISDEQLWTIRTSNPHSVIVMLDGGFDREAQEAYEKLLPLDVKIARLPPRCGPDDIPRRDLVKLLLSVERTG